MTKQYITIIDYGSGNLRSAAKAFEHIINEKNIDAEVIISGKAEDIERATRLVLPGQGAFGDCIDNLQTSGLIKPLEKAVLENNIPFLGICVGMQLLATRGLEHGSHAGLDWVPGIVTPITPNDKSLKIPHMGWNDVHIAHYEGSAPEQNNTHFVLRSAENSAENAKDYYFVHSYMFECEYDHHILGVADYGGDITAIVGRDNIIGVQFHPEKSAQSGLELLERFTLWEP